jgi:hypothetical protein
MESAMRFIHNDLAQAVFSQMKTSMNKIDARRIVG